MQSFFILGRQPELGRAELESLYGPGALHPIGEHAVIVDVDPCVVDFARIGGSLKFCKLLTEIDARHWNDVDSFLVSVAPEHSRAMPAGKMYLGISAVGFDVQVRQLQRTGLAIKKAIRSDSGRSVRVVPNQTEQLNSAQVIYNRLTGLHGWELVVVHDSSNGKAFIAQTIRVQDINSYRERDRERPKRDSKVGMLPPKLAQIIVNLAIGNPDDISPETVCEPGDTGVITPTLKDLIILDPFCGSGVILQEAALMGYHTYGTDLEERMVEYSRANMQWLIKQHKVMAPSCCRLETADATGATWHQPIDAVASETYLGRPFTSTPTNEILQQTVKDCDRIIGKFLKNIARQLRPGTRLCLAVPAWWKPEQGFVHLPLIDLLDDLGYNRMSFEHAGVDQLVYHRTDQIVARELLVITRK